MVLGMRGKNRRSGTIQIDYLIHIHEIKPWPPSQVLTSLHSVLIQWKNGESASGSTNLVAPSLGSVIGEGRIEFDKSFRLPVTLLRDMSVRGGDADVYQRNCLEFDLYEPRRDKTLKGQLLGTAVIDLADYGIVRDTLCISAPMNCKKSYRNSDQPILYIKIQPVEKNRTSHSLKDRFSKEELKENSGSGSVSALMNEDYAEEAEIASFTDYDVSSHSSVAAVSTPKLEENVSDRPILNTDMNGKEHPLASESRLKNLNMMQEDRYEKFERSSSYMPSRDESSFRRSPVNAHDSMSNSPNHNLLSNQKNVASTSADSSSPSLVCDDIDVNYRSRTLSSDHENLDQNVHDKIVLRIIISEAIKDSVQSNLAGTRRRRKSGGEGYGKIASSLRCKNHTASSHEGFGNWDDPHVFISALEKVEAWIFSRIVESIWWQTLTPHMQIDAKLSYTDPSSGSRKSYRRLSSPCDHEHGNLSLHIWKNAFRETCERICPIRAGGHDCGCLPMLPRLIMEQCVARLDVAMFNAILRESSDEMPTDPISDPINDAKVLPIPPGKSSFGAGAQLKTVVGNWSRWLSDLFDMDDDDSLEDKDDPNNNNERLNKSLKSFNILNALSDLLMLPKDMLLHASLRKEVCPMFSASLVKKILEHFVSDEFYPDPVPTAVFEALESENDFVDGRDYVYVNSFPCIAAPIAYSPPPVTFIGSIFAETRSKSQLQRSRTSIIRKSYTSDDEVDELRSPLSSMLFTSSLSSAVFTKPSMESKAIHYESPIRYELLHDMWTKSE